MDSVLYPSADCFHSSHIMLKFTHKVRVTGLLAYLVQNPCVMKMLSKANFTPFRETENCTAISSRVTVWLTVGIGNCTEDVPVSDLVKFVDFVRHYRFRNRITNLISLSVNLHRCADPGDKNFRVSVFFYGRQIYLCLPCISHTCSNTLIVNLKHFSIFK